MIRRRGDVQPTQPMADLLALREQYLDSGQVDPAVRPVVLESWQRCRDYALDPLRLRAQQVDAGRLSAARRENRLLLEAAEPLLILAHQTLGDRPHLLALSDPRGFILRLWADAVASETGRNGGNLFEGASWAERDIGCNGIGTCLHVREPVILIGAEHFQEEYVGWTCIGVPLKHADGSLAGALDLSVPNQHVQTHTWGWILSIGSTIERALAAEKTQDALPLPAELSDPMNTVRGVLDLLGRNSGLSATHIHFVEEARRQLNEADRQLRCSMSALGETQQHLIVEREALRKSEERFRLSSEASQGLIYDWDMATDEMFRSAGLFNLIGYHPEEVPSDSGWLLDRVHAEDLPAVQQAFREATAARAPVFSSEYRVRHKDGRWVWVSDNSRLLYGSEDRPVRMIGNVVDVTERKLLEQQREHILEAERAARTEFEHAVRLKDEFLATVSHELRSPLGAIIGWSNLLTRGKVEPGKAIEIIQRSASSLSQLVEDLLDMSRISSGKVRLNIQPVDVPEVVSKVVEAVQFSAQAKSIDVAVRFESELAPVDCDPSRLQQILWNLLSNAIKFTPEQGRVSLAVTDHPSKVVISVEDTGKGIDPEFLPHVFEQFRQEQGGVARRHGGLGLGLSIVKRLVELHGGTIEAHSEGKDKGATFVVSLPRAKSNLARQQARPLSPAAASEQLSGLDDNLLAGLEILVVDDDAVSRDLLIRVLSDAGAGVRAADTAAQACAMLEDSTPDLLISDLGMPDEDGFSFIRRLRSAEGRCAELPALAVSALSRPEDCKMAIKAGYDDHVSKPFDPSRLCLMVQQITQRRRARKP